MVINKKDFSEVEYVLQIQNKNEKVIEHFYHAAWKYFKESYKVVFSREDLMYDIFQQSFVKLWTEIVTTQHPYRKLLVNKA